MTASNKPTISFEFFPPKTEEGRAKLMEKAARLTLLDPSFMTVTYGAGGSTQAWTLENAVAIQNMTNVPTAAHLTCINSFKESIHDMARLLWRSGIRHIVALRGDVPEIDMPLEYGNKRYYHYANELVAGLKSVHDFEISVAAYPEKHPEAPDLESDISHLKRKCERGVARAITQFFFDNDVYFRFLDKAQAAGISTPVVPGLLPIADFESMLRFAARCEANVPDWLRERFAVLTTYEDRRAAAQEILTRQVQDLTAAGVPHIHFYTLNRAGLIERACKDAGLGVK